MGHLQHIKLVIAALVAACACISAQAQQALPRAAKPPAAQKPIPRAVPVQVQQRVDDRQWQTLADQAEELLARGDFPGSERVARQLVEEAGRVFSADHVNMAGSLAILGGSLLKQGKYPEAETIFRNALGIYDATFR